MDSNYREKAELDAKRMREKYLDYLFNDPEKLQGILQKTDITKGSNQKIEVDFEKKMILPRLRYKQPPSQGDGQGGEGDGNEQGDPQDGDDQGEEDQSSDKNGTEEKDFNGNQEEGDQNGQLGSDQDAGDKITLEFKLSELINKQIQDLELDIDNIGTEVKREETYEISDLARRGYKWRPTETLKNNIIRGMPHGKKVPINLEQDGVYHRFNDEKRISKAVVLYILDSSASMGEPQINLFKGVSHVLTYSLKKKHKDLKIEYGQFDIKSSIIDEDQFYKAGSGGGTVISKGLELIGDTLNKFPDREVFVLMGTDGENFNYQDNDPARLLLKKYLKEVNTFYYLDIKSSDSKPSNFRIDVKKLQKKHGNLRYAKVDNEGQINNTLRRVFGKRQAKRRFY